MLSKQLYTYVSSLDCPIASCQECSQPYACQTCEAGFYLTNNACASCGSALPGCVSCRDKNTCQACGAGFSLEGYSCVLTAPSASSEAVLTTQLNPIDYFKFGNFASFILCNLAVYVLGGIKKVAIKTNYKAN